MDDDEVGYPHDLGNRPIFYPQIVGCVLLLLKSGFSTTPADLPDPTGLPGVHAEFRRHGSGKGVDCFSFFHVFFLWGGFPNGTISSIRFSKGMLLGLQNFCSIFCMSSNRHNSSESTFFQILSMFAFDVIISICIILPVHPSMPRKQRICCLHRGEP